MMHCRVCGHVTKQKICNKKKQELHQCIKSNALLVLLIISDNDYYDDGDPSDDDDNNDNDDVDVDDNAVNMVALLNALQSNALVTLLTKCQQIPRGAVDQKNILFGFIFLI